LSATTTTLLDGLASAAAKAGVPVQTTQVGGMFGLFFTEAERVVNFAEAGACDVDAFRVFFHGMLRRGVYLAPSAFEAGFVSSAHSPDHIEATVAAAHEAFAEI
jgi:glutamate-1-semialdehyde 2,1-aminomutase